MRECYTSKVFSKPPCLIAKMKLEKYIQLEKLQCLKKQTGQGISKSKVTKSLRAHKNVRSDF